METECKRNLEGNFKVSLQGVYGEYIDILKVSTSSVNFLLSPFYTLSICIHHIFANSIFQNLDIKTVEIEGTQITIDKVFEPATFAEILGIEELRARRAAAVRVIDLALSQIGQSHPNYAFRKSYENRKFVLLTREERLENEFNRNKIALVSIKSGNRRRAEEKRGGSMRKEKRDRV